MWNWNVRATAEVGDRRESILRIWFLDGTVIDTWQDSKGRVWFADRTAHCRAHREVCP